MDADLVSPAGLQADVEKRMAVEQPLDVEMRDGVARPLRVERHARRVAPVAADRRLDPPVPRPRPAPYERLVAPLQRTPAEEVAQAVVGRRGPRDEEQAGGVPVEPVSDAGPVGRVAAGEI